MSKAPVTVVFIRWKDACSEEAAEPNTPVSSSPLIELREVGFLIGETEESVSIAMELEPDDSPSRWRLHIPKSNILERVDLEIPRKRKRVSKASTEQPKRDSDGHHVHAVSNRVRDRGSRKGVRNDEERDPQGAERIGG